MNADPPATRSLGTAPLLAVAFSLVAFLSIALGICAMGSSWSEALARLLFAVKTAVQAGGIALLWLASAFGLGRLWRPSLAGAARRWTLQLGLGIATLLWLTHALGVAGLLAKQPVAWGLLCVGVALAAHQMGRPRLASVGLGAALHPVAILIAPPLAIVAVAASSVPGWLWDTENFGFDALEYHLQLPAEWLASGRLSSVSHNVYSFLPNYLEAAYLHIASLFGSMYAANGLVLLSAQYLHFAFGLTLAFGAGAFVAGELRARGGTTSAAFGGALAAVAILSVPYTQVTASMAYNEMGLGALLLAGFVACMEPGLTPLRRGAIVGWLAGLACAVKLPGLFFVAAPLALLLAARNGERRALLPAGAFAGLALAPYFLRNAVACGNPVFPFATEVFGLGHWSPEQLARWDPSHQFTGSLVERLATAWANGPVHSLWSIFLLLASAAAGVTLAKKSTRSLALRLVVVLAVQLFGWIFLTHLLARFLLPILAGAGILIGLAGGLLHQQAATPRRRRLVALLCALAILPLTVASLRNVARQRGGAPAAFVGADVFDLRTGRYFVDHPEFGAAATIEHATNFLLPPGAVVYVIGESRVLYTMRAKIYNTPWDRPLLGELMRSFPDAPARWARGLADLGVTHVRVSFAELDRIQRVDRIADPLVSVSVVERFLEAYGRPVFRKDASHALFELRPGL